MIVTKACKSIRYAAAYCASPPCFCSYKRQVGSNVEYLLCLNNEQVTSVTYNARVQHSLTDNLDEIRSARDRVGLVLTGHLVSNTPLREAITSDTANADESLQLMQKVGKLGGR